MVDNSTKPIMYDSSGAHYARLRLPLCDGTYFVRLHKGTKSQSLENGKQNLASTSVVLAFCVSVLTSVISGGSSGSPDTSHLLSDTWVKNLNPCKQGFKW